MFVFGQSDTSYVKAFRAKLYEQANSRSLVLEKVSKGTIVIVEDQLSNWSKVQVNGKRGYILNKRISKTRKGEVLICNGSMAYAYHRYECEGLLQCTKEIKPVNKQSAIKREYRACRICY